jgi:tRNA A37 threonylcarbamoyladenosine synthetase subunit TsaC/SUA5/YrdC
VIVSSANREKKGGDTSPAQIRKNFGRELDLFIEDGELVEEPSSTVVEVTNGAVRVVRAGAIDEEFIREALV